MPPQASPASAAKPRHALLSGSALASTLALLSLLSLSLFVLLREPLPTSPHGAAGRVHVDGLRPAVLLPSGGRLPEACLRPRRRGDVCLFRTSDFLREAEEALDGPAQPRRPPSQLEWRLGWDGGPSVSPLVLEEVGPDHVLASNLSALAASLCLFSGSLRRLPLSPPLSHLDDRRPSDPADLGSASLNLCKGGLWGVAWVGGSAWEVGPEGTSGGVGGRHSATRLRSLAQPSAFHFSTPPLKHPPPPTSAQDTGPRLSRIHNVSIVDVDADTFRKGRHRRSSGYSHELFVEVLVVADRKMETYHGRNLNEYVLTLFSTVASIYRHPSLEAAVNIVVVRIHASPGGLRVTENAAETLKEFCLWQKGQNGPDGSSGHHDVAILLTRENICRAVGKCDTLGLAELGTMCDPVRSCAIIEDNGLSAAFTIAHELGHIFNFPHDDEQKCGEFMALGPQNYHIMAPTLEFNTHPWSWSPCSAAMLQEFLDSRERSSCILGRPVQQGYMDRIFSGVSPGETFDTRQQCQFVFGPHADICPYMPACKRLWCVTAYGYKMGCRTQHMPWADGTACGSGGRWCYRGECVGLAPSARAPVNGQWGEWGPYAHCSRSCGGGVKKAKRACNNPTPAHGGKYCAEGERVKYKPCNTRECGAEAAGFRESQCAAFDGRRIHIHGVPSNVSWLPKYQGIAFHERCKLHCEVSGSSAFYILKDKVVDGTRCGLNTDDLCVNGQCLRAGCDNRLGSTLVRDNCGVCGGDNQTCSTRRGVYDERVWGYRYITTIPSGATHVEIRQEAFGRRPADDNYLALKNSQHRWLLNGDFQITPFPHDVKVRGTVLHYSGSNTSVERINSTSAVQEDIQLHILSVNELSPPKVSWAYIESDLAAGQAPAASRDFYWALGEEWEPCDRLCSGTQRRRVQCVDATHEEPVDERRCADARHKPPAQARVCNAHCRLTWDSEAVGPCSAKCGPGRQRQRAFCVQEELRHSRKTRVDERNCAPVSARPADSRACHIDCDGRFWSYAPWGPCSATCGGGTQSREARCRENHGRDLHPSQCSSVPKQSLSQPCNTLGCPRWAYDEWEPCSRSCDGGQQRRRYHCEDGAGRETESGHCETAGRPDYLRRCAEEACVRWHFGVWEPCPATCGEAYQQRQARCLTSRGQPRPDADCVRSQRIVSKRCSLPDCPNWDLGEWSRCSKTCLDGWQTRKVTCRDATGGQLDDSYCADSKNSTQPPSHKPCHLGSCPFWRAHIWSKCSVSCGSGFKTRRVECRSAGDTVDDSICPGALRPAERESCTLIGCPAWEVGPLQPCSVSCGEGKAFRSVRCVYPNNGGPTADSDCSAREKPKDWRRCTADACPRTIGAIPELPLASALRLRAVTETSTENPLPRLLTEEEEGEDGEGVGKEEGPVSWVRGAWGACAGACSGQGSLGWQHRQVVCRDVFSRHLPDLYCPRRKPRDRKACDPCPSGSWGFGTWSACDATCGSQVFRRRSVYCEPPAGALDTPAQSPAQCSLETKPAAEQLCDVPDCPGAGLPRALPKALPKALPQTAGPLLAPALLPASRLYRWKAGLWQQCSASCGGGEQRRSVRCEAIASPSSEGAWVSEGLCAGAERPSASRPCNAQRCRRLIWTTGKWSACSRSCGPGVRRREVGCTEVGSWRRVLDDECAAQPRPADSHRCRVARCPRWRRSKWTPCSVSCGEGVRSRRVECYMGRRQRVMPSECATLPKPQETARCRQTACPSYNWGAGDWSKCSHACREGRQVREVYCLNSLGQRAAPRMCEAEAKPPAVRHCVSRRCPYAWAPEPWSSCSVSCGVGERSRSLYCSLRSPVFVSSTSGEESREPGLRVPDPMCQGLEQPALREECTQGECSGAFVWSVGSWSACSASCGRGLQQRLVHCLNAARQKVHGKHCERGLRPKKRRQCYLKNCAATDCEELRRESGLREDGPQDVLVQGFPLKVYCHRMNETHPGTYLVPTDPEANFAEIYGKRLLYPFTCPHNGRRNDDCQCTDKGNPKAGKTVFSKLRVDLQNMKLVIHDFAFARQEYGAWVPLGVAGDCYSAVDCPQGRFRLELGGTGLAVGRESRWEAHGHRTSLHLHRHPQGSQVNGSCGGYCGQCYPDKWRGIRLVLHPHTRRSPSPKP